MTDLTDLKTPFGLLDRETQEALRAHGGPYEVYMSHPAIWTECQPAWSGGLAIRVKPAPPKPREFWIVGHQAWDTYAEAYNACDRGEKPIHVREVTTD